MTDKCPDCGEPKEDLVLLEGEFIDADCDCGFNWSELIEKTKELGKSNERVCPKCNLVRGTFLKYGTTMYNRLCEDCGYQFHDTIKFYNSKIYMGIIDHNGLESFVEVGTSEKDQELAKPQDLWARAELNQHRDAYVFMSEIPLFLAERVEKLFTSENYEEAGKQLRLIPLQKFDLDEDNDYRKSFNKTMGK